MVGSLELLLTIKNIAEKDCTTRFTKELYEEHQAIFNIQKTPNLVKLYNSIVFSDNRIVKHVDEGISGGFANIFKAEICNINY